MKIRPQVSVTLLLLHPHVVVPGSDRQVAGRKTIKQPDKGGFPLRVSQLLWEIIAILLVVDSTLNLTSVNTADRISPLTVVYTYTSTVLWYKGYTQQIYIQQI